MIILQSHILTVTGVRVGSEPTALPGAQNGKLDNAVTVRAKPSGNSNFSGPYLGLFANARLCVRVTGQRSGVEHTTEAHGTRLGRCRRCECSLVCWCRAGSSGRTMGVGEARRTCMYYRGMREA